MNGTLVKNTRVASATPLKEAPVRATSQWMANVTSSPLGWATVTCVLLAISGGIHLWRDWKFQTLAQKDEICPFRLADLPRVLGSWRALDEPDGHLDPQIARIAGSREDVIRHYQDDKTGELIEVMVLYGFAYSIGAHSPDVCYPAVGYKATAAADDTLIIPGSKTPVRFHRSSFYKRSGSVRHDVEVVHTFLHNNEWLPEVESRWKMFRAHPAMFKIQLERVGGGLSLGDNPSESLLKELIGEINRRVAAKPGPG